MPDGKLDVFSVFNRLRVHSGADGALLAQNDTYLAYFVPAIEDMDFDGVDDITLTGGYYAAAP